MGCYITWAVDKRACAINFFSLLSDPKAVAWDRS